MSRSNTPSGHTGQPPQGQQQWRMQPELEVPPSRGGPGQLPAAGQYAPPYPPAGQLPPGYAYPPQPQAYGQAPPDQGYAYANPPAAAPGGHQFSPPPAAPYAPQDRYAAPAPQMPDLRGSQFDQWPAQPAAPQAQNPQAYDLGNYNPASLSATQPQAYQQPAQAYVQAGADFNQPPQPTYASSAAYGNYAPPQAEYQPQQQWTPQDVAYQGQQQVPNGAAGYDQGYPGQQQRGPQPGYPAAHQPQAAGQVQPAGQYDDEDEYEEEEPSRRGRGLMVVAALVGAIGLGGGLAYGYKTFMKPPSSGSIPVARADKQPAKVKPATPDGKQMAGNGSALQNGDDVNSPIRPVQASASADAESNGSRKVQTMQVGRDGSIAAQQQQTQATTVPGMQMVFPSTPNQQRAMPVPNLPESQPAAPQRVTANVPAPMNAATAAVPAAPKKVAQVPVPKKPAVRDDLAASGGSALGAGEVATPAAPRKPSGAGFMAVLSLQKSQLDAMRVFADMQQKYPALQGKQPVVQEADLSAKGMGVVYRLMAGPPGSLAAAKETCTQMTAAGHKDCWAMNY
jgi:hypothetical protein